MVVVFSILNVLGYLAKEQYNTVSFFLLIGVLSTFYIKNMAVVLLIAMGSTLLLTSQNIIEGSKEGADTKIPDMVSKVLKKEKGKEEPVPKIDITKKPPSSVDEAKGKPVKSPMGNMSDGQCIGKVDGDSQMCGSIESVDEQKCNANSKCEWKPILAQPERSSMEATQAAQNESGKNAHQEKMENISPFKEKYWCQDDSGSHKWTDGKKYASVDSDTAVCPSKSINSCKSKEECDKYEAVESGFSNMKSNNVVANASREGRVDGVDESIGDRIDYAETTKQAMNNLQDMLGSDGMKGLASETQKLVSQQKELVDSLGQMAPVLSSAKNTLDKLQLPDMKGLQGVISALNSGSQK